MRVYVSFVHGGTFGYRLDKYGRLLNNATAASPLGSKQVTQHRRLLIRLNHPDRPSRLCDSPLHFPQVVSIYSRNVAFCRTTRARGISNLVVRDLSLGLSSILIVESTSSISSHRKRLAEMKFLPWIIQVVGRKKGRGGERDSPEFTTLMKKSLRRHFN